MQTLAVTAELPAQWMSIVIRYRCLHAETLAGRAVACLAFGTALSSTHHAHPSSRCPRACESRSRRDRQSSSCSNLSRSYQCQAKHCVNRDILAAASDAGVLDFLESRQNVDAKVPRYEMNNGTTGIGADTKMSIGQ